MTATVEFNGLSLDEDPYHLDVIEGLLGSPNIRTSDLARVARSGMVAGTDYYSGRTVTLTVNITAHDLTDFGDAVAAFAEAFAAPAADEAPLSFTIPGIAAGTAARLNVRPRKMAIPLQTAYHQGVGSAAVELFASDPLIYSESESTATITVASDPGGLEFDLVFDAVFGGGGSFGSATLTNSGSALAPVSIRINGPTTNPTVRNATTGQSLAFTATVASGDYLVVDTQARTVLLNGTADRYSYLTTPQWWGLEPGANEIRYFADITSGSTAVVTYRSAWL